jgi:hypothetical protein
MRPIRLLYLLICILMFTLACTESELPPMSQPIASTPTDAASPQAPTRIPAISQPSSLPPSTPAMEAAATFPLWVTNFADPILASLVGRRPDFQDEFTRLNRGWFYEAAGSPINPYYAHIGDGDLILKLPEGQENTDLKIYNSTLNRSNFVLSFDLRFGETQPDDFVRFQYNPTADQVFSLDLSKNKNWNFRWLMNNDWKSIIGTYDQFPPERINVKFIVQDSECGVYLNHTPLDYSENCIPESNLKPALRAVSFHLIAVPGHTAIVYIDNVKMWDLDEAPFFPAHP